MLETWIQWTCDGCGATESASSPNATRKEIREWLRACGWGNVGKLDYCKTCVAKGYMRDRRTDMNG